MKKIKIYFTDFWQGFSYTNNFIYNSLAGLYDIEISENNPDYLFYSVFGNQYIKYDCIRIFYTGENVRPNFNLCDYGIGFDYMDFGDRYFRYPHWCLYPNDKKLLLNRDMRPLNDGNRKKFCNFIYSNPKPLTPRDEFFKELSKYKQVDSGGKHLNTIGEIVENKFTWISEYKFTIAFENTVTPGYTTEKIVQAFAANTIPIYYGDPEISKQFNSKGFINVQKYRNFEDAIKRIIELDNDNDAYMLMLEQKALVEENVEEMDRDFQSFLIHILEQGKEQAVRRVKYGASEREENYIKQMLKNG